MKSKSPLSDYKWKEKINCVTLKDEIKIIDKKDHRKKKRYHIRSSAYVGLQ